MVKVIRDDDVHGDLGYTRWGWDESGFVRKVGWHGPMQRKMLLDEQGKLWQRDRSDKFSFLVEPNKIMERPFLTHFPIFPFLVSFPFV